MTFTGPIETGAMPRSRTTDQGKVLQVGTTGTPSWVAEVGHGITVFDARTDYHTDDLVLVSDPRGVDWEWHLFRASHDIAAGPVPLTSGADHGWELVGEHVLFFDDDVAFGIARAAPGWEPPPKGTLTITKEGVWEAETGVTRIAATETYFYSTTHGGAPPFTRDQVTRSPNTGIATTVDDGTVIVVYTDADPVNRGENRLDVYVADSGEWVSLTGDITNDYAPATGPLAHDMRDWFKEGTGADTTARFGTSTISDLGVYLNADRTLGFRKVNVFRGPAVAGWSWKTQPVPAGIDVHPASVNRSAEIWRKRVTFPTPLPAVDLTPINNRIDALVTGLEHGEAAQGIVNDPPTKPVTDELWIVGDTPTGAFATHDHQLALWDGAAWSFAKATAGEAHLVEAQNAIYSHNAAGAWVKVGNVGASTQAPVGEIIMWPSAVPPTGFLLCDGLAFDPAVYPDLATVLPGNHTPNLVGQFIRGGAVPNLTPVPWATGMAKTRFATGSDGDHAHGQTTTAGARTHSHGGITHNNNHNHRHQIARQASVVGWSMSSDQRYMTQDAGGDTDRGVGAQESWDNKQNHAHQIDADSEPGHAHGTSTTPAHSHGISGGDAETAPDHVVLAFVVRAQA